MKSKWTPLIIILAIVVILVMWVSGSYNGLVKKSEEVKTQQSNIQTQLQRAASSPRTIRLEKRSSITSAWEAVM
jgi:hypothetical protein